MDGFWIESWTSGPIATNMGGEPGVTVLPTALAAGVATLVFSTATLAWSIAGVRRDHGPLVLTLLSAGMLLAGGGVGPPVMGAFAGLAAMGITRWRKGWMQRLPGRIRRGLAGAWPPLFAVAVANAVFLVIGSVTLVYAIDFNNPSLFTNSFYVAALSVILLAITGAAYEAEKHGLGIDEAYHRAHDRHEADLAPAPKQEAA